MVAIGSSAEGKRAGKYERSAGRSTNEWVGRDTDWVRGVPLQRLSEQVLAVISEDRDALQRPVAESERRIDTTVLRFAYAVS
jgi:hypothetical protein